MSSIVTAVFKATIGLLVNKGRDKAAEKLKDGDVTDQKFRGLIVREIDDIKSKLDGISRKDLLASISFFEEGIELLYKVFDKARSRSEYGAVTTQADCAEVVSLAEGVRSLELTDLHESAARALSKAKKRFEDARREATRAFNNEALETSDRILAMQYRVMATILETVDNPVDAVEPCRVCIKELNSLSAVQNSFDVQLKKGLGAVRGLFGKDERGKIISRVCHVNRVIYDVTQTVGQVTYVWTSPSVDIRGDKVDLLRDERVTKVLRKQSMEHCSVTWSFNHKGEGFSHKLGHWVKAPCGIATNSSGQFILGHFRDSNVKVFDNTGTLVCLLRLPYNDDIISVEDVATDITDNIFVLVGLKKPGTEIWEKVVCVFNNTADLHHKFPVRDGSWRLTVTDSGKLMLLRCEGVLIPVVVDMYYTDGQFVRSFGKDISIKVACDITAANDGRVMVVDRGDFCVHIFSEHGDHLNKFKLHEFNSYLKIAYHRASEHVVVAGKELWKDLVHVDVYTKDGEFVSSTQIHDERIGVWGMTVTTEGRIAVVNHTEVLVI